MFKLMTTTFLALATLSLFGTVTYGYSLYPTQLSDSQVRASQCSQETQIAGYACFQLCDQRYPDDWAARDACKEECARRMFDY
jgi:hypothetical protein